MSKKNRAKRKASNGKPSPGGGPQATAGLGWLVAAVAAVAALMFLSNSDETTRPKAASPAAESREAARPMPGSPASRQPEARPVEPEVPPFYEDPEAARPFPSLLPPSRYGAPVVARAYEIAGEIPEVLVQQPCYCNCGGFGHGSLLDCFASDHGAT